MSLCSTNRPLVTPKAGDEHQLLLNKLASEAGLLNIGSCLARALGVTKFINIRDIILVSLCWATESNLDVPQTHL